LVYIKTSLIKRNELLCRLARTRLFGIPTEQKETSGT
jgi:hypothetical protein